MTAKLQPLDEKFAVTKSDGRPTEYFIRWAQQRQIDINAGITEAQARQLIINYLAAHQLQEGSGIDITPDGDLSNSPTITARVQAILDQITTTQGAILFRSATAWEELVPGTDGEVLTTRGAAADPEWDTASGLPPGGTTGEVLTKLSGTDYDADWEAVPHELPVGGTTGQLLAKNSGTNYDVEWVDPATFALEILQDNTLVGDATALNFTGSGVTVTDAGMGVIDVDIPGGSSSGGILPVVDGSIPPVFIQLGDGSLVYTGI